MYHSHLLINAGDNPDRPDWSICRRWLRNLYRVHQRLCMAFPSEERKDNDPDMLRPYRCKDFGEGHVHAPRGSGAGFLFRVDPQPGGRAMVLVQSAIKPDWNYAFHNARYLLAASPETRTFSPSFERGRHLRFRLQANPVRRIRSDSLDVHGQRFGEQWIGKRVPVPATDEHLRHWLERRAPRAGFRLVDLPHLRPGYVHLNRTGESDGGLRLRSARFEGVLEVADSDRFNDAIAEGIGPAKAFGFGLLSVAPV